MARTIQGLQWVLLFLYSVSGAVALMMTTTSGLRFLGQSDAMVTFLPARIIGLPWSLPLFLFDDGPVTSLALLGVCYGLNLGIGLMLARAFKD